uniref:Uncharacterized protein n=1 Tax=Cacopsylla melanoneura TaxID=428564 RepID=A0A8D8WZR6_9HEMI
MMPEEVIKTIDFEEDKVQIMSNSKNMYEDNVSNPTDTVSFEDQPFSSLTDFTKEWKEKLTAASSTLLNQCKEYYNTLTESLMKLIGGTNTENRPREVAQATENVQRRHLSLAKPILLLILSELSVLWCSYVIGQYHGIWRHKQAQEAIKFRTRVY